MICAVVRVLVGLMPSIALLAFLGWGTPFGCELGCKAGERRRLFALGSGSLCCLFPNL